MNSALSSRARIRTATLFTSLGLTLGLMVVPASAAEVPTTGGKTAWTYVTSARPAASHWNSAEDAPVGWGVKPAGIARSFFRMDISAVTGRHVLGARLLTWLTAGDCEPGVELWLTGDISPKTTWFNQPAWRTNLGPIDSEDCEPPASWAKTITQAVVDAAAQGERSITLGLRSAREFDLQGRAVFESHEFSTPGGGPPTRRPILLLEYNTVPQTPVVAAHGESCAATGLPAFLATRTPTFRADIFDEDLAMGQQIQARFQVASEGGEVLWEHSPGTTALKEACGTVAEGLLQDGESYRWRVRVEDGFDVSEWTLWQGFTVDVTPPDREPLVTSTDFPEYESGGQVGVPGTFTFGANGVTDVVGFSYEFNGQATQDVPAGPDGTATMTFTPEESHVGPVTLWVVSRDRAGNPGPAREYLFFVNG